jgi:(S)-ureidoglycine aminohydrolase
MQRLGHTRSSHRRDHLLQTPDTFVRAPLPGMEKATAIVHVAPAAGARFTQYTAEFEAGGRLARTAAERFLYVLEGSIRVAGKTLGPGGYAYLPPLSVERIESAETARAAVIEKPYLPLEGVAAPGMSIGVEADVAAQPLLGDPDLLVRPLIPADTAYDFAVNTMTYAPGAALAMVEIHVMEHGLLMLEGGGIYRLGDEWYPVTAGDFIWMGPYCPQWFGAIGKTPAKYLIYKDWNRHPLE